MGVHFITPAEAEAMLEPVGFGVSLTHSWYRVVLYLKQEMAAEQGRVAGRPPRDSSMLPWFALRMIRWLPNNEPRLLWVDHSERLHPSMEPLFLAARSSLGEDRSLEDAPGLWFDSFDFEEQDRAKVGQEHARQVGLLTGLLSLIIVGQWDAWLISPNHRHRIELVEGNIFFYSDEDERLAAADALFTDFDCPRQTV